MASIKFKFSRDVNGNRTIKVSRAGMRGFSIQTNGNLPQTHRMTEYADNKVIHDEVSNFIIHDEVLGFCKCYGTEHQKKVLS